MANYVDKKELERQIVLSKADGKLNDKAVSMLWMMTKEISRTLRYKNEDDKNDCMQEAAFDILKYWQRFDPDRENSNCFAYFTELIKNGHAKGFKKLRPASSSNMVSIDEETGIYNI